MSRKPEEKKMPGSISEKELSRLIDKVTYLTATVEALANRVKRLEDNTGFR